MSTRVEHAVASGTFSLDGETFDVENNIWLIGDDDECVVIDAPHDVEAIRALVGNRTLKAILCTHAHDDHVRVAPALREATGAPIMVHPDDLPLWKLTHLDESWDHDLADGMTFDVAGVVIDVLHTPGHAPGAVCFYVEALGRVFTGDTLFDGGPGATGRSFSDSNVLLRSIAGELFGLPGHTRVHTGHGRSTTIDVERLRLQPTLRASRSRVPGDEMVP